LKRTKQMFSIFLVLLSSFLISSNTFAGTILVSSGGNIQAAINSATDGDFILVDNGTYTITSTITISIGVTIRSKNGPENTVIDGSNLIGCVHMTNSAAILDGFTITHGNGYFGGGVQCDNGIVQNCIIENNNGTNDGGGVALSNSGMVINCIIRNNTAVWGGGVRCFGGTVRGCLITGNTANPNGGGVNIWTSGTIQNCTIVNNTAANGSGIHLWNNGSVHGVVENSIIYNNTGSSNCIIDAGSISYCCTTPAPDVSLGTGNITADPLFVNATTGDYRLSNASTLIDAGSNADWMNTALDLNDNNRILYDNVDIGAYEYKIPYVIGGPIPVASWPVGNPTIYTNPPTLNWYLGVSTTGLSYEIQYAVASDSWPEDDVYFTSSSLSYTIISALTAGVQYAWRVRSTSGTQKSAWSTTAYFTMVSSSATGPVIPTASWPVGNPTIYVNPPTLNWYLEASSTGLSYEIQYAVASDSWPNDDVFFTSSSLSYTITSGLPGGVQYAWRVRSNDGTHRSSWSATAYFTMVASTATGPVIPTASWPVGNPTIYVNPPTLNWYLGTSAAGLTYQIQCVVASGSWPADDVFFTSSSLSYTVTSTLEAGVQYAWRVRSTNGTHTSNWSTTAYFTMVASSATGPVVPTPSWPVGNPTNYVNPPALYWYLGASSTGLTYQIQCVPASGSWPTEDVFVTSSSLSYTITSALTSGVQYAWRVRSTNGSQTSAWSTTAYFTMVAGSTPVQPITGSPTDLALVTTNSPELFWYLPTAASSEQEYQLKYSTSSDMSDAILISDINSLKYKLNNLNSGATYYWTVQSKNSDGIVSLASKQGSFTVESVTDVEQNTNKIEVPEKFSLYQNFPNPFNPTTKIGFGIAEAGRYSLRIFNVLGQEVTILANRNFAPGTYEINFNAGNLMSGIYFYQLNGDNVNIIKKMILAK